MSNIHGLSFNKNEKKADQEEFFGGGATSGTAVWRPTNGPQREGAASPQPAPGSTPATGEAADLRQIIQQARSAASSGAAPTAADDRNIGLITIYSNGFIMGNGEFRDVKDPRNAAFVASLKKGEVPTEMEAMCRSEWGPATDAVRVNLVDKSSEAYTPPKPKFNFATSKGQQLQSASTSTTSSANSIQSATIPAQIYTVDSAQPTTTLQIVLADRRKLKATFNAATTILQLYAHVKALSGQQATGAATSVSVPAFDLVSGFPPKPLSQPQQTLKDAGLMGASVTQQLQR